jgi:nitrate/TMAO reductase-like tetraheme cytochrome c subunit
LTGHLLIVTFKQNKNIMLAGGSVIKGLIFISFLLGTVSLFIGNSVTANPSSCINCHTNEAMPSEWQRDIEPVYACWV